MAVAVAVCFFMAGCDDFGNTAETGGDTTVTSLDLTGRLYAPAEGEEPQTKIEDEQYMGTVVWLDDTETALTEGVFGDGAYTAVITLTAGEGWTFDGVPENGFSYDGADVENPPDSGEVRVSFPPGYSLPIGSAADLAKIGTDPSFPRSGVYRLTANLNLDDWIPIGTADAPFTGRLMGAGRTITVKSFADAALTEQYIGIFGNVEHGRVQDLSIVINITATLSNKSVETKHRVGALAGHALYSEFSGINVSGSFNLVKHDLGDIIAGGIIGVMERSVIRDSVSTANLTGNSDGLSLPDVQLGGITASAGLSEIHGCVYDGDINATSGNGGASLGGIAGKLLDYRIDTTTKAPQKTVIAECSSSGTMNIRAAYGHFGGGIAGTVSGSRWNKSLVTRSRSDMAITVNASGNTSMATPRGEAGGIAGNLGGNSTIENCYSAGDVTITTSDWSISGGGITGTGSGDIVSCYSAGTVTATSSSAYGYTPGGNRIVSVYGGGIAGKFSGTIKQCAALNDKIVMGRLLADHTQRPRRIVSEKTGGTLTNNAGNSAVVWEITKHNDAVVIPELEKTADGLDGADCVAKPDLSFFTGTLCWDSSVWKMGGNGYPALAWEQ